MRKFISSIFEVTEIAIIAIAAVILIRSFLIQPFLVSGTSMAPNFHDGDYLLVDELTYRVRVPSRGEVAVFHYPNDESTFFIKRIIGLPGERITIVDGVIKITNKTHPDGLLIEEDYLSAGTEVNGVYDVLLGEKEYFLLGDNRSYSFDSRSWGPLRSEEIVGVVRLRLWPPKNVTVFAAPQY